MKHILITGASSGFGRSLVERFLADPNWTVHATSRSGDLGGLKSDRLFSYALDLERADSRKKFCESLRRQAGELQALVNNAGFGLFGAFEDLSEDQIRRQMEVNFMGTVLLTQELLPYLRASHGRIVNVSSTFGTIGFPLTSLYCASKFALEGWSEALRFELKAHGVGVTVVEPGAHRTGFAKNVEWGVKSFLENSPFISESLAYQRLLTRLSTRPRYQKPENVSNGIYRLITEANPPLRKRFGVDAAFTYLLQRLLPARLMVNLYDVFFRKLFYRPLRTAR